VAAPRRYRHERLRADLAIVTSEGR
jgi:hypothetical protein